MKSVIGVFAWIVANVAYVGFRRTGEVGFKRIVAFFMGWPATLITMFVVREGSQARLMDDDAGLDELEAAIRRDRLLRGEDAPPDAPRPP